jgi:hypothetical protein
VRDRRRGSPRKVHVVPADDFDSRLEPFDGRWLSRIAEQLLGERPWLPEVALRIETAAPNTCCDGSCGWRFVPDRDWEFDGNVIATETLPGGRSRHVVFDLLKGERIGGIEFA